MRLKGPGEIGTAVGAGDDLGRAAGRPGVGDNDRYPTRPRSAGAAWRHAAHSIGIRDADGSTQIAGHMIQRQIEQALKGMLG